MAAEVGLTRKHLDEGCVAIGLHVSDEAINSKGV
jgi:hypothetical protein